ncbi:O-glycosyl hydrolase [Flavobacterium sp. 7E]|uniref:RICIN domain-containing protein n=1 Tax=Flavobacterium sp. 7E TaxID=2735898 RepID=UPI001570AFFB|nr:RICIN domain-containing protein [Flavobacterium sp. 7E]NRS88475.1 O-glycosyl hydrolase [Flavobacterium sp. 7E]
MKMTDKHIIKSKFALIITLICSMTALGQSITLNTTDYKQTVDMMGGDMERSSINIQWSQNKEEMIDWGFKDIAFNYCRVQYDKNQELVEGIKNWAFYDKQVLTMQRIKLANPNIKFFATMRTDYDGYGDDNNMPDWIVNYSTKKIETDKYAVFLADYLEYMYNKGITIHTLSITKEWTSFVYASRAKNIIPKLHAECDARGIPRVKISDQGFWSISQGISYINDVTSLATKDLYDSFCSHDYQNEGTTKWASLITKSNALGKKVYDDETSTGAGPDKGAVEPAMSYPIDVYIKKAIAYNAGLNGEIFFEIWSRGINTETRSIYCPWKGTGTRLRGYYIMKQFANNILDSKYITATVNAASNVYTISFRKDNKVVLWVINKGTTNFASLPVTLNPSVITSKVAATYWTNSTPITGSTTSYTASGKTFAPKVEAESINCYLFDVADQATSKLVQIKKRNASNFAIDGNSGGADKQNVYLWLSDVANVNQQWIEIDRGNGYYSYQKMGTNYCIDGNSGGVNGQNVYLWSCDNSNQNQQWKKVDMGSGYFRLEKRNASGFSLDGGSGGKNGQNVALYDSSSTSQNLQWSITEITTTAAKTTAAKISSSEQNTLSIYPNPVEDVLTLDVKENDIKTNSKVNIYDNSGLLVKSFEFDASNPSLSVKELKAGLYFIHVEGSYKNYTNKFIKK